MPPAARRGLIVLAITGALLVIGSASAAAAVDTSSCTAPSLSQPFVNHGDSRSYALVPGQQPGSFTGDGWSLSGGAQILTRRNGTQVLDLPSGAQAVSPTFCVNSSYPIARTMIRGGWGDGAVSFYVSYQGTPSWDQPVNTGQINAEGWGWALSDDLNMAPSSDPGWQLVRLTLVASGTDSDFRLYNLYVDPYSRG
jgi:hypothetical protein